MPIYSDLRCPIGFDKLLINKLKITDVLWHVHGLRKMHASNSKGSEQEEQKGCNQGQIGLASPQAQ